jgi:hypothetical protein
VKDVPSWSSLVIFGALWPSADTKHDNIPIYTRSNPEMMPMKLQMGTLGGQFPLRNSAWGFPLLASQKSAELINELCIFMSLLDGYEDVIACYECLWPRELYRRSCDTLRLCENGLRLKTPSALHLAEPMHCTHQRITLRVVKCDNGFPLVFHIFPAIKCYKPPFSLGISKPPG